MYSMFKKNRVVLTNNLNNYVYFKNVKLEVNV